MKLYDKLIEDTDEVLAGAGIRRYLFDPANSWKDAGASEFIMQKDAALEIGGATEPSVNYTLVTSSDIVTEDEIFLCGYDINNLKGSCGFARIVILETTDLKEDEDSEKAFNTVRNLEFVRYHVFPKGYMVRVSSSSNQEQVRVSREALKGGISFEKVGNLYIKKYKEIPEVKHVRIIFITDREIVKKLLENADKADSITKTLTHILDGMPTDCGHCSLKPVCDEVEGMKELHFKSRSGK